METNRTDWAAFNASQLASYRRARGRRRLWTAVERAGLALLAGGMAGMVLAVALAPTSLALPWALVAAIAGMSMFGWAGDRSRGY